MTEYSVPDTSGTNPDHLQANFPFILYAAGIKLPFEASPIFVDSLTMVLTDGTGRELVKDVDWEVKDDDIDHGAMIQANLEVHEFDKLLVKSVSLKSTTYIGKRVAATFQQFYQVDAGRIADDGRPIEFTPDVLKSLISGVAYNRQQIAQVNSPVVTNLTPPRLLPFDINKERSGNLVVNEPLVINTNAGPLPIRPVNGPFFADSLVIRQDGTALNPTTDYTPIVLSSLTNKTTNPSGIYSYILITKPISGTITYDYHAVGGEVQPSDISSLYDRLVAITSFLSDSVFITSETVQETPAFRALNSRTNILEDDVRRLLTGSPTYGDSESNNAVTRPITAPDSEFHWWSIASLYQVEGSSDIIRSDQFKGRVFFPDAKITLAFTLDVNFDQIRNKASFTTDALVFDPLYSLFSDLSVAAPQYPMIRVVWNEQAQSYSGATIQIGIPLTTLNDRMVVENLSTAESCWILNRENELPIGQLPSTYSDPQDSGFTLPDGVSVWSPSSSISFDETFIPRYENGYLVYNGTVVSLDDILGDFSTVSQFSLSVPEYFPIARSKYLVVTLSSVANDAFYDVEIPLTGVDPSVRMGRVVFADSDKTAMNMTALFSQDVTGNCTVSLNVTELAYALPTSTPSDKTDLIRYIRVKV